MATADSDADLVLLAQAGSHRAFEALMDRYWQAAVRLAWRDRLLFSRLVEVALDPGPKPAGHTPDSYLARQAWQAIGESDLVLFMVDGRGGLNSGDQAIATAREDQRKLEGSLAALDPDRATAELKAALRARPSPMAPDTPEIVALRKRYETIARLVNRVEDIDIQISGTLIDAETLAAQTIVTAIDRTEDAEFRRQLGELKRDASALADAHRAVADL